tara:strand:- start:321 stop:1004 length:684 start_codon:yes stop_codon:yes gene_type:complete
LTKRLTEKQKANIVNSFKNGSNVEYLSEEFKCTISTIIRNLKKDLGEKTYKLLAKKNKNSFQNNNDNENINVDISDTDLKLVSTNNDFDKTNIKDKNDKASNQSSLTEFVEIAPLNFEIENSSRKELSSIPIDQVEFPKVVYMIVYKNIELEIKLLKDYPDWEFLPNEDLNRKTIEIFLDLNTAKRACGKEHKVLKVPNTNVFKIVSPILISRGISRIVSEEKLIAL